VRECHPKLRLARERQSPTATNVATLKRWVEECGYHCARRSVPGQLCHPLAEQEPLAPTRDHAALERADHADGHRHSGHAGMSMDAKSSLACLTIGLPP
jgi:Cu2+-exporting ATPase